jgi:hypothetical protein
MEQEKRKPGRPPTGRTKKVVSVYMDPARKPFIMDVLELPIESQEKIHKWIKAGMPTRSKNDGA